MFGISMALGPVLGGFLVSAASWRAVFLVSLPVGLAAIVLAARFVPESLSPRPRRFDPAGQVLVIAALAALTYAVIEGGRAGFGTARIVILLTVAAGCLAGLVRWELRRGEPRLEVRLFTSAPFAGASAIAVCLSAALGGFLFMNTLYLQDVRGLPALHAGLTMLPTAAMVIVFAPVSGRLTGRFTPHPAMPRWCGTTSRPQPGASAGADNVACSRLRVHAKPHPDPVPNHGLTIADAAERTGFTAHTLRYYEPDGLLLGVSRAGSGHRRYAERDLGWIELITKLRATGMPIGEIRRYAEWSATAPATSASGWTYSPRTGSGCGCAGASWR